MPRPTVTFIRQEFLPGSGNIITIQTDSNPDALHVMALSNDSVGTSVTWTAPAGWVQLAKDGNSEVDVHMVIFLWAGKTTSGLEQFQASTSNELVAQYYQITDCRLDGAVDGYDMGVNRANDSQLTLASVTNFSESEILLAFLAGDGTDTLPMTFYGGSDTKQPVRSPDSTITNGVAQTGFTRTQNYTSTLGVTMGGAATDGYVGIWIRMTYQAAAGLPFSRDGIAGDDIADVDAIETANIGAVDGISAVANDASYARKAA